MHVNMLIELRIPFLESLSYQALISDRKMRRVLKLHCTSHSRSQSFDPFGQLRGSRALAGSNLQSANCGLPVRLRSRKRETPKAILVPKASILLVSGGERSPPLTKRIEALGTRMRNSIPLLPKYQTLIFGQDVAKSKDARRVRESWKIRLHRAWPGSIRH